VGFGTAVLGWFHLLNVGPVLATTALLLYGLWQLGAFQRQERPWRLALDRTRLVALVNFGLSPFLYWWNRLPENDFFSLVVGLLAINGLLFLFNLNLVIARLGEMLPDETLRQETRHFTTVNRLILVGLAVLLALFLLLAQLPSLPPTLLILVANLQRFSQSLLLLFVLLPLSLTMALLWKTKEVIMDSVFSPHR
jgi:hypothetical protein